MVAAVIYVTSVLSVLYAMSDYVLNIIIAIVSLNTILNITNRHQICTRGSVA